MRKQPFCICICENIGADQLRGQREADQRICCRYTDSTMPLLAKFIFCACTDRFVSDMFGNCWFSHEAAQQLMSHLIILSRVTRKPTMWFSNGSDTHRPVQAQKMARGWKFYLYKKERNCSILLAKKCADLQTVCFLMLRLKL